MGTKKEEPLTPEEIEEMAPMLPATALQEDDIEPAKKIRGFGVRHLSDAQIFAVVDAYRSLVAKAIGSDTEAPIEVHEPTGRTYRGKRPKGVEVSWPHACEIANVPLSLFELERKGNYILRRMMQESGDYMLDRAEGVGHGLALSGDRGFLRLVMEQRETRRLQSDEEEISFKIKRRNAQVTNESHAEIEQAVPSDGAIPAIAAQQMKSIEAIASRFLSGPAKPAVDAQGYGRNDVVEADRIDDEDEEY